MTGTPIRRCPECGEEFQPHIVNCSDCGTPLESAFEGEAPALPAAPERALADEEYVTLASQLTAGTAEEAAQALAAEGIAFRLAIDVGYAFRLVVEPEAVAAAMSVLAREGVLPEPPDSAPGAVAEEGGPCPACNHRVAPGTVECPGCGLQLAGAPACQHCGEDLEPTGSACLHCGRPQD